MPFSLFEALQLTRPKTLGAKPGASGGQPAKPLNDAQQAMMNDATAYAPILLKAQTDLAALPDPLCAPEKARIQAAVIDPARAKAKAGDYKGAMQLLGQMAAEINKAKAAVQKAQDQQALVDARKVLDGLAAETGVLLAGVTEPHLHKKIDADLTALKGEIDTASKLADSKAAAQAVLALKPKADKLKAGAQAAKVDSAWIVTNYAKDYANIQGWINSVPSSSGKRALQAVYDALEAEKNGYLDAGDAASVRAKAHPKLMRIYTAAQTADFPSNKLDKVYRVQNLIDKIGVPATPAVQKEIDALLVLEKGLPKGATIEAIEDSLKTYYDRLAKLRKDVEGPRDAAVGADSGKKKAAIEKTLGLYKGAVDGVSDKKLMTAGTDKLAEMKKALDAALALKDAGARGKALVELEAQVHAELKEMKTHAIEEQIQKSGTKAIDDLIAAMGKKTGNDDDLTVCEAALQARFGIKVEKAADFRQKSLPQLYAVMAKVPQWQSKQSMFKKLEIDRNRKGGDAYYADGKTTGLPPTIALHDLPDGDAAKVPDVDPKTKTVKASYFDFTTLHEVGHAVDAKVNFMGQRMDDPAFGGWRDEKSVDKVVAYLGKEGGFIARHTGGAKKATEADLKALLLSYINSRTAPKPLDSGKPLGSLRDEWDAIVDDDVIKVCVDGMRIGDAAWEGGAAKAARLKVAGRCFHNSYGGDTWVSYDYGSRAPTGISTYQWRAPGEWFAEIYALYYVGKLAETHPMTQWFKESAVSEEAAKKPAAKKAPAKAKG